MKITTAGFYRCVLKLSEVSTDSKMQRHQVRDVPAPFCRVQYLNDQHYLPGDESSTENRRLRPRKTTVK